MAFKNDLKVLITNIDEQNTLWRALLQSIHDHGGRKNHLDRLLADTKNKKVLIDQIAQLIVGPIWGFVNEAIDIGLVEKDFDCPAEKFMEFCPEIGLCLDWDIVRADKRTHPRHPDHDATRPKRPCRYRLCHCGSHDRNYSALENLDAHLEHASWRELAVFLVRMEDVNLRDFSIIAAGSKQKDVTDGGVPFPIAGRETEGAIISWRARYVTDRHTQFYLVRDYSAV